MKCRTRRGFGRWCALLKTCDTNVEQAYLLHMIEDPACLIIHVQCIDKI